MEWFGDSVVNAISQCRQQRALFIVYIRDESKASEITDSSWNSQEVLEVLSSNPHVAIKLINNSLECRQFSQLFPVLLTPCVFCIGVKGEALETSSGEMDPTGLAHMLSSAFQKLNPETTATSNAGATASANATKTQPLEENEETDPSGQEEKLKSLEEKKQQLRQRKEAEAKEKEKEREMVRRKEGQEIGQWKKDKLELERQQLAKERRRQKMEEERARKEVLAKLEQDKRERAEQRKRLSQQPTEDSIEATSTSTKTSSSPPATNINYNKSARIQVKLPYNETTVLTLAASDTVLTLRQQIAEFMEVAIDSFSMASGYPRKDLTPELDHTSITNHGLVPSGTVIVKSNNQKGLSPSGSGGSVFATIWGALLSVLQYIVMILASIKNSIFGGTAPSSQTQSKKSTINRENQRFRKFNQDDYKDDDDEKRKETYNGNSTQQL